MYKRMFLIIPMVLVYSFIAEYVTALEKYPEKPIQAIVAYAPGGSTDAAARMMADFLKKHLGQPVIIVNKAGGGGAIGGNELFKSKPV